MTTVLRISSSYFSISRNIWNYKKKYTQLEVAEKLTILLSTLILVLLVVILGMVVMGFNWLS